VNWLDDAACRGTIKPEVFYDSDPRIALEVCRGCPSLLACRADGDATETANTTFGVRGGETEWMREQRRRKTGPVPCPECPRSFRSQQAVIRHRTAAHGYTAAHGSLSRYAKGCRCDECKRARGRHHPEREAQAS
jgi:uncharacterized C2H2 Zn-finger protein